jgi:hypothetical protein
MRMAKEIQKLICVANQEGAKNQELLSNGWKLSFDNSITREEAMEMLSRDRSILNDCPNGELPKDQPLSLRLYERDKAKEKSEPNPKKNSWNELSPKEQKREKREPVIWLIICSLLFSGSFAFVIYAAQLPNKDFTFYMAIVNSVAMLFAIVYSIFLIVSLNKKKK